MIAGGGKIIYFLTKAFFSKGYHITIVNRKKEECSRLARQLKATVVFGNATDPYVLKEAQVSLMDAVLAITPNDEDNLVICQLAKLNFGIQKTLAHQCRQRVAIEIRICQAEGIHRPAAVGQDDQHRG